MVFTPEYTIPHNRWLLNKPAKDLTMNPCRNYFTLLLILPVFLSATAFAQTRIDLQTAVIEIDTHGYPVLEMEGGPVFPPGMEPVCEMASGQDKYCPESVSFENGRLTALFPGGGRCEYAVNANDGFVYDVSYTLSPSPAAAYTSGEKIIESMQFN